MEGLPKDVIEKITKEVSITDFLNFCEAKKNFCTPEVWRRRLYHDYPFKFPDELLKDPSNYKKLHLELTTMISDAATKMKNMEGLLLKDKHDEVYWFSYLTQLLQFIFNKFESGRRVSIEDVDDGYLFEFTGSYAKKSKDSWIAKYDDVFEIVTDLPVKIFRYLGYIDETGYSSVRKIREEKRFEDNSKIIASPIPSLPKIVTFPSPAKLSSPSPQSKQTNVSLPPISFPSLPKLVINTNKKPREDLSEILKNIKQEDMSEEDYQAILKILNKYNKKNL